MNFFPYPLSVLVLLTSLGLAVIAPPAVLAGPGHSHAESAPAQAAGPVTHRIQAHSEAFELVGIVEAKTLSLFLDEYATNEPIERARIEIEAVRGEPSPKTLKVILEQSEDGVFKWTDSAFEEPAVWAVSFTITAGKQVDILAGELDIHLPQAGPQSDDRLDHGWVALLLPWLIGAAVSLLLLACLVRGWTKRRSARAVKGLVVLVASAGIASLWTKDVRAHGDHDSATLAPSSNAPKRMSDGAVFLPKISQRQLEVRTMLAQTSSIARTIELNGVVVQDPGAGGRVQSALGGRLDTARKALPRIGQSVRRGEVLASVTQVVSPNELANQRVLGAEAQIKMELSRKRVARLEQLEGSIPQSEIDAAKAELRVLEERNRIFGQAMRASESLIAPTSGVVAAVNVVAGQVVAANDVLFEIVDPQRFRIEALVYDPLAASAIRQATATTSSGVNLQLALVGAGRLLKEQAVPVLFKVEQSAKAGALAVGQPVVVRAQLHSPTAQQAIRIPTSALIKGSSNQDIVWVHTDAETFKPRNVRWQTLDGTSIAIIDGLKPADRVVVRGASLVNQVR
jgi:membrane fusion protein, heavy metal efflux system